MVWTGNFKPELIDPQTVMRYICMNIGYRHVTEEIERLKAAYTKELQKELDRLFNGDYELHTYCWTFRQSKLGTTGYALDAYFYTKKHTVTEYVRERLWTLTQEFILSQAPPEVVGYSIDTSKDYEGSNYLAIRSHLYVVPPKQKKWYPIHGRMKTETNILYTLEQMIKGASG